MTTILLVFVGVMCMMLGVKTMYEEEQNKVFNKRKLPLQDVKKYNRFCGILIIGFGVAADLTIVLMANAKGWLSLLLTVILIAEAVVVMKIYSEGEKRMIKKR